jgi:predicted RNase H-like HicB family nuclease
MAAGKFVVEIEQEVDGRWIAEVVALPGVLAYGATRDDAREGGDSGAAGPR